MEMHHMVGTLEVFDVREGQHPQTRRRGYRDGRAVLRLGGPGQQSVQLFRRDRQQL